MRGIGKVARNERTKLQATSFNAVGLGFLAVGVIQPAVVGVLTIEGAVKLVIAGMVAYIFHRHAMRLLESLED